MTKERAREVFDMVPMKQLDLMPIEELVPLSFIGQKAVTFYREKVKLMNQLDIAEEQKQATLADGQDAGRLLLEIEARIGELLPDMEEVRRKGGSRRSAYPEELSGKNRRKAQAARAIASHPEAVAEVIHEAEENEDIPTKTAVLNKIKLHKYEEKHEREPEIPDIRKVANSISDKLTDCYTKLAEVWPYKEQIGITTRQFIKQIIEKLSDLMGE